MEEEVEILKEEVEKLEKEVDYWRNQYDELFKLHEKEVETWRNKYDVLEEKFEECKENGIRDIDYFIWKLKNDGLYTNELEQFIENYMKWNND